MNQDVMLMCEALKTETNPDRFWTVANRALANYGVTSILYSAIAFRGEIDPNHLTRSSFLKSNHCQEYFDTFGDETVLDGDLTSIHCVENTDILLWHGVNQWASATPEQRRRADIERDMGLFVGVSIPASRFGAGQIGGLGVSMGNVSLPDFDKLWRSKAANIISICGLLDAGMRRQHLRDVVGLSGREKDCLTWLAAGLRPDQIASRLAIGRSSIDKYIANCRVKLKAATLEQAVAKAILFNLIQP
jgi:DNA-binding CsgD family transcriptional regulator